MKLGFVAKHRGIWPLEWVCEALGVSRSGFYSGRDRPLSERARPDAMIGAGIKASFQLSDRPSGARRVQRAVRAAG